MDMFEATTYIIIEQQFFSPAFIKSLKKTVYNIRIVKQKHFKRSELRVHSPFSLEILYYYKN